MRGSRDLSQGVALLKIARGEKGEGARGVSPSACGGLWGLPLENFEFQMLNGAFWYILERGFMIMKNTFSAEKKPKQFHFCPALDLYILQVISVSGVDKRTHFKMHCNTTQQLFTLCTNV